jgi:hypothetical protein
VKEEPADDAEEKKRKNNCILKDKMETGLIQAGFFLL